ncbi:MAG: cyclic nucleotide-binding domain-containing protein [Pedosphaera sp.]|nr:cyclic nucleotide-binding domain-containing protein [Pedosphaera sp.]
MVALESAELFRNLRPDEVRALRQVALEREYAAGQEIFREGDRGDGVYVVKSGTVEISGLLNQTTRRNFSQIKPGGMFGEMAVIEHRPRSASATAISDTIVYFIPRGEMLHLIERSPGLALSLLQQISQRLRDFNQLFLSEVVQAERLAVIGRFARSIVHDLKNPLNIIGITAEVASMPNAPAEMRAQASSRIRKQVERINELVGEILLFTQGDQSTAVLVPVNFAEFITQVVEEMRHETELKSVKVELAAPPPAVKILLDPKRLRRVFFNLSHNATDAMPEGGKIILRFDADDAGVITEVEDTGSGIAPEILDRLFEAFATHGKSHGTGLGLSICKKIVEDHGGRIWARNEPGRGAVFAFVLPLAKPGKIS